MKSTWVKFLVLAVAGFALGAAFALFQQKNQGMFSTPVSKPVVAVQQPPAVPAPVPASPPLTVIVPTHPVLEGVPSMPGSSGVAEVQVGGAFSLIDHHGTSVTEKSWPGKYKLVFFGFTHCADTCPTTLQKLCTVLDNYDPEGKKLVPLFITVDPARDTKEVMAAYVESYEPHVTGLTGTPEQVKAAEDAYKVYAAKEPGPKPEEYEMSHSSYVYLMSPDDKLLETFAVDETVEGMITKIKLHLQ